MIDALEQRWMRRRRSGPRELVAGIHVRQLGRGSPTIVLAADPPNVLEHLAPLATRLAERYRVVCIELPGFGFSDPDGDLAGMLVALDAAPYVLALSCAAGLLSASLAAAHPQLVSHVIGVQTPGLEGVRAWAARVDRRGLIRTRGVGQALVALRRRRIARGWYDVAVSDPDLRRTMLATTEASFDAGATYPLASALQTFAHMPAPPPIAQPTLFVWGARDRAHRTTRRDELAPGAPVVELATAAHFPELEDSEGFTRAVHAFLDERQFAG